MPAGVRVTVSFWFAGDTDGENDSIVLPGSKHLAPGRRPGRITARRPTGSARRAPARTSSQHSAFKDMLAKVFVDRRGTIYRLGEFPIVAPDHSARSRPRASVSPRRRQRPGLRAATLNGGSVRTTRRHRRLERHRRRHFLRPGPRRGARVVGLGDARDVGLRRRARVCRRDGLRGTGRASAARRRRYVYLRDAFGQSAAFLTGWTSFVAGFSGGIAAGAVALADCLGRFLPAAADRTPLFTLPIPFAPLVVSPQSLVALTVDRGRVDDSPARLGPSRPQPPRGRHGRGARPVHRDGLSIGAGVGRKLREHARVPAPSDGLAPRARADHVHVFRLERRDLRGGGNPRSRAATCRIALGVGTLAVVIVYLALNLLYSYALPIGQLASLDPGRLTDTVAERLFGFVAGNLLAGFTIVQHRGERERDGAGRTAHLLRDGA